MKIVQAIHLKTVQFQDIIIHYCMKLLKIARGYTEQDAKYKVDYHKVYNLTINATKMGLLFILFWLAGIFMHGATIAVTLAVFRFYTIGFHFENTFICSLFDFATYTLSVYLCRMLDAYLKQHLYYYFISLLILCSCCMISCFLFFKFAPARTRKSQIGEKRQKKLKRKSLIVLDLYFILCLITIFLDKHIFVFLSLSGLMLQTISIIPKVVHYIEEKGW